MVAKIVKVTEFSNAFPITVELTLNTDEKIPKILYAYVHKSQITSIMQLFGFKDDISNFLNNRIVEVIGKQMFSITINGKRCGFVALKISE